MLRMDHEQVAKIRSLNDKEITPQETLFGHKAISSMARLTLALRFLATRETYRFFLTHSDLKECNLLHCKASLQSYQ